LARELPWTYLKLGYKEIRGGIPAKIRVLMTTGNTALSYVSRGKIICGDGTV